MSSYKFAPRASPDAPQKPLVRKRARSGGAEWVRVTRHAAKQAEKPRVAGSQQPACTYKEHQIFVDLTTDCLWATPLNTGWAPVKARRLQDWGEIEEIRPHSQAG